MSHESDARLSLTKRGGQMWGENFRHFRSVIHVAPVNSQARSLLLDPVRVFIVFHIALALFSLSSNELL